MPETKKVLVVDDEQDVLDSMAMQLRSLGYEPIILDDPAQVIEIAERDEPGLILQDLRMDGLNVAGLVASLRSNPKTAKIPIVFFSASAEVSLMAAKYDAWGYLQKPFAEEDLVQILDRALGPSTPPAPKKGGATRMPLQHDLRALLHDYWNLFSALSSYTQTLLRSPTLSDSDRHAVKGIEEVLVRLESKTDRLQAYLQTVIA